jgi:hypothetical protein
MALRDVARNSAAIARKQDNSQFYLATSKLHRIEAKGQVPSLHYLYSLASIYGLDLGQVLSWYLGAKVRARLTRSR